MATLLRYSIPMQYSSMLITVLLKEVPFSLTILSIFWNSSSDIYKVLYRLFFFSFVSFGLNGIQTPPAIIYFNLKHNRKIYQKILLYFSVAIL